MVMDPLVAHVTADAGNRIVLPKKLSERIEWLIGAGPLTAWAFLLCPGRIRILSDEEVEHDPTLEPIRAMILKDGDSPPKAEPTIAQDPWYAAFIARLIPIEVSRPKTGWRLLVPRSFEAYLPTPYDRRAFSVVFSEGYLEVWQTGLLSSVLPTGQQKHDKS